MVILFARADVSIGGRAGLQSQQWGRKKAAALAAARLAEDGAEPLRPHVLALLNALLTEVAAMMYSRCIVRTVTCDDLAASTSGQAIVSAHRLVS